MFISTYVDVHFSKCSNDQIIISIANIGMSTYYMHTYRPCLETENLISLFYVTPLLFTQKELESLKQS